MASSLNPSADGPTASALAGRRLVVPAAAASVGPCG